jgi:hypothetical protein
VSTANLNLAEHLHALDHEDIDSRSRDRIPAQCLLRLMRQNLNPRYFLDGLMHLLKTNRFISVQFTVIFCERQRAGPSLYKKLERVAKEHNENLYAEFIARMAQYDRTLSGFVDGTSKDAQMPDRRGGEGIFQVLRVCCHPEVHHIRRRHLIFMTLSLLISMSSPPLVSRSLSRSSRLLYLLSIWVVISGIMIWMSQRNFTMSKLS